SAITQLEGLLFENRVSYNVMSDDEFDDNEDIYGISAILIPNVTFDWTTTQKAILIDFMNYGGVVIGYHDTLNFNDPESGLNNFGEDIFGITRNDSGEFADPGGNLPNSTVIIKTDSANEPIFDGLIARYNEFGQTNGKEFYLWTPQNIEIVSHGSGTNITIEPLNETGDVMTSEMIANLREGGLYHYSSGEGVYHITSNNNISVYVTTDLDNPNKSTFYSSYGNDIWAHVPAFTGEANMTGNGGEAFVSSYFDQTQIILSDYGYTLDDDGVWDLDLMEFSTNYIDRSERFSDEVGHVGEVWHLEKSTYPFGAIIGFAGNKNMTHEMAPKYEVYSQDMKKFNFTAIGDKPTLFICSLENSNNVTITDISTGSGASTTLQLDKDELKRVDDFITDRFTDEVIKMAQIQIVATKPIKVTCDNYVSNPNYKSGTFVSAMNNYYGIGTKYIFQMGSSNYVKIISVQNNNIINYSIDGTPQSPIVISAGQSHLIEGLTSDNILVIESDIDAPKNFVVISYYADSPTDFTSTSLCLPIPAVPNTLIYDTPIVWKGMCDLTGSGTRLASNFNGFINITKRQFLSGKSYYIQTGKEDPGYQWSSGDTLKSLTLNAIREGIPVFKPYVNIELISTSTTLYAPATPSNPARYTQHYTLSVLPHPQWAGIMKAGIRSSDGFEDTIKFFTIEVKAENTPPLIQPVINDSGQNWWEIDWKYRIHVTVSNQNNKLTDFIVMKKFDFKTLLESVGETDVALDVNSFRVVPIDDFGKMIYNPADVATQFVEDDYFHKITNPKGAVTWRIDGSLDPFQKKFFYIYFDIEESGGKIPQGNINLELSETAENVSFNSSVMKFSITHATTGALPDNRFVRDTSIVYKPFDPLANLCNKMAVPGWNQVTKFDWTEKGPFVMKISAVDSDLTGITIESIRQNGKVEKGPEFILYADKNFFDIKNYGFNANGGAGGSHLETYWMPAGSPAITNDFASFQGDGPWNSGSSVYSNAILKGYLTMWNAATTFDIICVWDPNEMLDAYDFSMRATKWSHFIHTTDDIQNEFPSNIAIGLGMNFINSNTHLRMRTDDVATFRWYFIPDNNHSVNFKSYGEYYNNIFVNEPVYIDVSLTLEVQPDVSITTGEDLEKTLDLMKFEKDHESSNENLTWTIGEYSESIFTIGFITENDPVTGNHDLLTITPKDNVSGSEIVQITLEDEEGLTDIQDIMIIVGAINDPPKITQEITGTTAENRDWWDPDWHYKAEINVTNNTASAKTDNPVTKRINFSDLLKSIEDGKTIDPNSIRIVEKIDNGDGTFTYVEVPASVNISSTYILRTKENENSDAAPPGWNDEGYVSPNILGETLRSRGIPIGYVRPEDFETESAKIDLLIIPYGFGIPRMCKKTHTNSDNFWTQLVAFHKSGGSIMSIGNYPFSQYFDFDFTSDKWVNSQALGEVPPGEDNGEQLGGYYYPPTDSTGDELIYDQSVYPGKSNTELSDTVYVNFPMQEKYKGSGEVYTKLVDLQKTTPDSPIFAAITHDENYENSILAHLVALIWTQNAFTEDMKNEILIDGVKWILNKLGDSPEKADITWMIEGILNPGETRTYEIYFDVLENGSKDKKDYDSASTPVLDTEGLVDINADGCYFYETGGDARGGTAIALENDFIRFEMSLSSGGIPNGYKLYDSNSNTEIFSSTFFIGSPSGWKLDKLGSLLPLTDSYNDTDYKFYFYDWETSSWKLWQKDVDTPLAGSPDFTKVTFQQSLKWKIVADNTLEQEIPKMSIIFTMNSHDPFIRINVLNEFINHMPTSKQLYIPEYLVNTKRYSTTSWAKLDAAGYQTSDAATVKTEYFDQSIHKIIYKDTTEKKLINAMATPLLMFHDKTNPNQIAYTCPSFKFGFNAHSASTMRWDDTNADGEWDLFSYLFYVNKTANNDFTFSLGITDNNVDSSDSVGNVYKLGWSKELIQDIAISSLFNYELIKNSLSFKIKWITTKNDYGYTRPKLIGFKYGSQVGGTEVAIREPKESKWYMYENSHIITLSGSDSYDTDTRAFFPKLEIETPEETAVVFDLSSYMTDIDNVNADLTWSIEGNTGNIFTAAIVNDELVITPLLDMSGSLTITLILTDSDGAETSQDITITITPVNDPPEWPSEAYITIVPFPEHNATDTTSVKFYVPFDNDLDDINGVTPIFQNGISRPAGKFNRGGYIAAPTNYVLNSSFENNLDSWKTYGTAGYADVTNVYSCFSSKSLLLRKTYVPPATRGIEQTIIRDFLDDKGYLHFMTLGTGKLDVVIDQKNSSGTIVNVYRLSIDLDSKWKNYRIMIPFESDTTEFDLKFESAAGNSTTAYVDGIQISLVDFLPYSSYGKYILASDLIENGGFEIGATMPDSWSKDPLNLPFSTSFKTLTDEFTEGLQAFNFSNAGPPKSMVYYTTGISMEFGGIYTMMFMAKGFGTLTTFIDTDLKEKSTIMVDEIPIEVDTYLAKETFSLTPIWKKYSITYNHGETAKNISQPSLGNTLQVYFTLNGSNTYVSLDDVIMSYYKPDILIYPRTDSILNKESGTISFWLRPSWDGTTISQHYLFQAANGELWGDNNIEIVKE
ncbi:hypothetical protein KAJ27_15010, partial [bacterium]|nr:hypothetical protein [bacterium]